MQGWKLSSLEEVCCIRRNNGVYSDLYIGLEHIGQGNNVLISKGNVKDFKSTKNSFKKRDILYGKLRPLLNKVYLATEDGHCSTDILPLRVNSNINAGFLLRVLTDKRFLSFAVSTSSGTKMPRTNWNDIKDFKLLLPPSQEQQKIASILSKVDVLIQKIDQIIEQTQRLKKGLMQKLLTKGIGHKSFYQTNIGEIPLEWKVSTIGSECKVGTGGTPSRRKPEYFEGNIPWVKTTEINYNVIMSTEECITERALKESPAKYYEKDTLLMAMYGEGVTRGRCAILGIDAAINQACAAIQSVGKVLNEFIFYWCQWRYDYLRSRSHGTHQSNFNLEFVRSIEIPLPSLKEQHRIVEILTRIDDVNNVRGNYKKKVSLLKEGLMQKLLTGKLRVKV